MSFITELTEGRHISQILFCKSKQTMTAKNGKSYYSMVLQDKTGCIDAKVWDINQGIENFDPLDFIQVDGDVTSFNNTLQLNIRRVRRASAGEYRPEDFFPTSRYNPDDMYNKLLSYIDTVKSPCLNQLLKSFFVDDPDFVARFKKHSAAKSVHHGFIAGLLQHTIGVTGICIYLTKAYPRLNHDLLLTAAMLHDIGKMEELSPFPANDYTDDGQLLGHIMIGYEMISRRIDTIEGFPAKTASELKHCILAHHGELEYGSPKKPALMEATALSMADNLDAKMELFDEAFDNVTNLEWQGFNKFLESNIRPTSPIKG